MSKPTKKRRLPDPNVTAFLFVQKLTGQPPKVEAEEKPKENTLDVDQSLLAKGIGKPHVEVD